MYNVKKRLFVTAVLASSMLFTGCSVGTESLFVHPVEQGYEYEVTFDTMGGHINQEPKRVVYFAEDALLYQPSGTSGMLVAPKNGDKTLVGWYTKYTAEETANGTVYRFDDNDLWDFSTDRINETISPDKKLVLYARWQETPSVNFVDAEDPDGPSLLKWTINVGSELKKPTSTEPKKSGYVLMDYYVDPECTVKFEFGQAIAAENISYREDGTAYINIYCKFREGEGTRIKTVDQLKAITSNPEGTYVLAGDLDLSGITWTPIEGFTGILDGNGYAIKNLSVIAKNKVSGIAAKKAQEKSFGLFATLDKAEIMNLAIENAKITIDKSSNVKLAVGTLAGRAINAKITNSRFDQIVIETDGESKADIVAAAIVAGNASTKITDTTVNGLTMSNIKTSGSLQIIED